LELIIKPTFDGFL